MKTKCLILFKEFGDVPGMQLPSMTDFFEEKPYIGKDRIISYLKKGRKTYSATSYAYDKFTGKRIPGEYCGMTDGEYSWNSSLAHYVEEYNLRLPQEFERKVLSM